MKKRRWLAAALAASMTLAWAITATAEMYASAPAKLVEREEDTEEELTTPPADELGWVQEMQALLEQELAKKAKEATPEELENMGSFEVVLPPNFDFVIDPFEKAGLGQIYSEPKVMKNNGLGIIKITLTDMKADKGTPEKARERKEKKKNTEPLVVGYSAPMTIGESDIAMQYQSASTTPKPDITIGASLTIGASEDLTIGESAPPPVKKRDSWDNSIAFHTDPVKTGLFSKEKDIQLLFRRLDAVSTTTALSPHRADKMVFILHPGESASFDITGTLNPTPEDDWQPADINITATYDVEVITAEQEALYWEEERLKEVNRLAKIEAAKKAAEEAANPKPKDGVIVDTDYVPPKKETDPNAPPESYGTKIEED